MSPRHTSRTQDCTDSDARRRLADALAQLDLAELATASSTAEEKKAAASCAVLAGIAAADAACCKALGRRSRSQDHRDAAELGLFRRTYNTLRPHQALDDRTPRQAYVTGTGTQ